MWSLNLMLTGCLCVLVLGDPCCCSPLISSNFLVKPLTPKHFGSTTQLRKYLDDVNTYYLNLAKPRFGKRTVEEKPDPNDPNDSMIADYQYQEQPAPLEVPDLLDILRQYYQPQEQE